MATKNPHPDDAQNADACPPLLGECTVVYEPGNPNAWISMNADDVAEVRP